MGLASVAVGPIVPGATLPGNQLRRILPPALVVALDKIADQIGEEVFDPLLQAASVEQLARIFERVFPKFRDYYASTIFIVWGWLQEDPQRFSALTIRSFQESEHLIRSHGPRWIGRDASLNASHGLATITRVAKAVGVFLDKQRPADLRFTLPLPRWRTAERLRQNWRISQIWRIGARATRAVPTTWPR